MKPKSKEPIYVKLVTFLKEYIEKNMKKDQKLLSEREISLRLKVSRFTVRQALNELERTGYIYKVHGKGTFVSEKSIPTALNDIYSYTEQVRSLGKKTKTRFLEFKIFNSDNILASKLNINFGEKVIKLICLRSVDNIPMMVEKIYLPYAKFPTLTLNMLAACSLYSVMKKNFNQSAHFVNEALQASLITRKEAKLLNVDNNTPCLKVERTSYNKVHEPIEFTVCIARGDKFVYNYNYIHKD